LKLANGLFECQQDLFSDSSMGLYYSLARGSTPKEDAHFLSAIRDKSSIVIFAYENNIFQPFQKIATDGIAEVISVEVRLCI